MEGEYIIGAVLDGQSVTIEPGGQFELSGAPVDTLHKTCSEVNSHLYQVCCLMHGNDVLAGLTKTLLSSLTKWAQIRACLLHIRVAMLATVMLA